MSRASNKNPYTKLTRFVFAQIAQKWEQTHTESERLEKKKRNQTFSLTSFYFIATCCWSRVACSYVHVIHDIANNHRNGFEWWIAKLNCRKWKAETKYNIYIHTQCLCTATESMFISTQEENRNERAQENEWAREWNARNLFKYAYHIRIDTQNKNTELDSQREERDPEPELEPISAIINAFCFRHSNNEQKPLWLFYAELFHSTFVIHFPLRFKRRRRRRRRMCVWMCLFFFSSFSPFIFQSLSCFRLALTIFRTEN